MTLMRVPTRGTIRIELSSETRSVVTRARDASVRRRRRPAEEEAMGIKGLPAVLEPYLRPTHVEEHRGARAAVDAYSWLHKGAFSCAMNLAPGGDRWWTRARQEAPYVKYCVHRARLLRFNGIEPVIVFDGDRLPAKREEEAQRRERR